MAINQYRRGIKTALTANFYSTEFDCKGTRIGCDVTLLNSKLYRKLQVLRNRIGVPIMISSGYRCVKHNARVGGTADSYHLKGYAADIYSALSPRELAKKAQEVGFTGIGMYDGSAGRFVHVDVRPVRYYWQNTVGKNVTVTTHGGKKSICPYSMPGSTLRRGSKGTTVKAVQWIVTWAGYKCSVDGIFGAKTEAAVKALQRDMLLTADGIVGKNTRAVLVEVVS